MEKDKKPEEASESSIVNRITMLLAAKRTSLAVLRTGLALLTLPFSVVTVLIATSRYYNIGDNLLFIVPLMIMNTLLVALAVYLIVRSMKRIHLMDHLIHDLKEQSAKLMVTTDWEEEFRPPHHEKG